MADTVIPFEPSAGQLHQLALEHWNARRQLDAISLMRRALSLEEGNVAHRAALAQFLTNAGCVAESMHVLAHEYARLQSLPLPMKLWCLAIDAANDGALILALIPSIKGVPWYLTNVPRESLKKATRLYSQSSTDSRAISLYGSGIASMRDMLLRGESARLCARIARAGRWKNRPESVLSALFTTIALCMEGDVAGARQAFVPASDSARAVSFLPLNDPFHIGPQSGLVSQIFTRVENLVLMAGIMCGAIALDTQNPENSWHFFREFHRTTHDPLILHLMAVTAYNVGAPDSLVAEIWNHIARLHPADPVAEELCHRAVQGNLPPRPMGYAWRLSEPAARQYLALSASLAALDAAELNERWERDGETRRALLWLMRARPGVFGHIAHALCGHLSLKHLNELANDFCYATGQNGAHLLGALACMPETAQRACCLALFNGLSPAPIKRALAVRNAQSGVERVLGFSATPVLCWLDALAPHRRGRNIHGRAAQLAWHYLKLLRSDAEIDPFRLARALDVSPRLVEYRIRAAQKEIIP